MGYKRFRHLGKDKVFMDFSFFAIAFNIKKMCAKMRKEGIDWLIKLFYDLAAAFLDVWNTLIKEIFKKVRLEESLLIFY